MPALPALPEFSSYRPGRGWEALPRLPGRSLARVPDSYVDAVEVEVLPAMDGRAAPGMMFSQAGVRLYQAVAQSAEPPVVSLHLII